MKKVPIFATMVNITPAHVRLFEKRLVKAQREYEKHWGLRINAACRISKKIDQMVLLRDELLAEIEPGVLAAEAIERIRLRIEMMRSVLESRASRAARKAARLAQRVPKGA